MSETCTKLTKKAIMTESGHSEIEMICWNVEHTLLHKQYSDLTNISFRYELEIVGYGMYSNELFINKKNVLNCDHVKLKATVELGTR